MWQRSVRTAESRGEGQELHECNEVQWSKKRKKLNVIAHNWLARINTLQNIIFYWFRVENEVEKISRYVVWISVPTNLNRRNGLSWRKQMHLRATEDQCFSISSDKNVKFHVFSLVFFVCLQSTWIAFFADYWTNTFHFVGSWCLFCYFHIFAWTRNSARNAKSAQKLKLK